ncbi:hypothetical protein C8R44DRAFT_380877 [Mycena epipterygia]|nr:hypothetical protein C8R44DRAFT_380877 [Mycena epipterygia]
MPATSAAVLQQILPLIILIVVPVFALRFFAFVRPRIRSPTMPLGALLPWNWGYSPHEKEHREHGGKRRVRTRAEQLQTKKGTNEKTLDVDAEDAYFPGLVNMSGTHCFMNSTLQALASLSSLPPHLLAIRTRAEALDVPTPVTDALLALLASLNTPSSSPPSPLRATALVEALCAPQSFWGSPTSSSASTGTSSTSSTSSAKAAALLASHEHQDAQELFQLLSECVHEESARVVREGGKDRGLVGALAYPRADVAGGGGDDLDALMTQSPFDGLTATRRACVRCGYTAAIRHFAFDSVQLALEGAGGGWGGTTLPVLLRAYTALEVLHDCPCRRCALRATARRLTDEVARLEGKGDNDVAEKEVRVNGMLLTNGEAEDEGEGEGKQRRKKKGKGKHRKDKDKDKGAGAEEADKEQEKETEEKDKDKDKETGPTPSRLRRLKAVRRMEERVLRALEAGRIEEEELEGEWDFGGAGAGDENGKRGVGTLRGTGDALKGVRIERVPGGVCTRQSMLGRPPAILALHINRSVHTGLRVAKNGAHVAFPELLDLAPYTTGGVLNLDPTAALNLDPTAALNLDPTTAFSGVGVPEECLYRLAAAVCHFGQHSFGHYICYRRAPVAPQPSAPHPAAQYAGSSTLHAPAPPAREGTAGTGTGWLRISDARVDRCGVEAVLAEGSAVFMLYYERVPPPPVPAVYGAVEGDSAETLRPGMSMTGSGMSRMNGSGVWGMGMDGASSKARVVRSVSVGMSSRASLSSSSLSLRSVSSVSPSPSPVPTTPRARPVGEDADAGEEADASVEALVLAEEHEQEDAAALPTPPPTPKSGSEPPTEQSKPQKARAKAKKKKKGKHE